MIKPMFGHRPQPRRFNMPLRYYNPEEDEKRKKRIRIKVSRRKDRYTGRLLIYIVGLSMVVWIISLL